MTLMTPEQRLKFIEHLHQVYPNPKCELIYNKDYEKPITIRKGISIMVPYFIGMFMGMGK